MQLVFSSYLSPLQLIEKLEFVSDPDDELNVLTVAWETVVVISTEIFVSPDELDVQTGGFE